MSVISGTQHFIIPKRIVWTALLVGAGAFLGMYLSEHIRAQQAETFLKHKNEGVKVSNDKLKKEKSEYQVIFGELTEHLEEWKKGRDMSLEQQAQHVTSFQDQAQALMEGLSDMQTLLEEKEFQLWEKEGLLEYQEERLMNSEDLELEMANYINEMAQTLLAKNATLPAGLEEKPYYGSQLANVDDDPANGEYGERRRLLTGAHAYGAIAQPQRRLRASPALLHLARKPTTAAAAGSSEEALVATSSSAPSGASGAAPGLVASKEPVSVRDHFLALKADGKF